MTRGRESSGDLTGRRLGPLDLVNCDKIASYGEAANFLSDDKVRDFRYVR